MIDCQQLARMAHTNAPATSEDIRVAEDTLQAAFSLAYAALLQCSNGLVTEPESSSILLYATSEIGERNGTYEVAIYLPEMLMIGDDGGGRGIFIERTNQDSAVYLIGMGSMLRSDAVVLASHLTVWIETGFPLAP